MIGDCGGVEVSMIENYGVEVCMIEDYRGVDEQNINKFVLWFVLLFRRHGDASVVMKWRCGGIRYTCM